MQTMKCDLSKRFNGNLVEINSLMAQLKQLGYDYCRLAEEHQRATQETYGDSIISSNTIECNLPD